MRSTPGAVLEVPGHGLAEAFGEGRARPPPELPGELGRVDRIASIVAGPIRDERDELAVGAVRPFFGESASSESQIPCTTSSVVRSLLPPTL